MKRSFVRAVSGPHVDYIAILQRHVNADKAIGREGSLKGVFPI